MSFQFFILADETSGERKRSFFQLLISFLNKLGYNFRLENNLTFFFTYIAAVFLLIMKNAFRQQCDLSTFFLCTAEWYYKAGFSKMKKNTLSKTVINQKRQRLQNLGDLIYRQWQRLVYIALFLKSRASEKVFTYKN